MVIGVAACSLRYLNRDLFLLQRSYRESFKIVFFVCITLMYSCASIVKGGSQKIFVVSSPSESDIKVKDQHGNNIISTVSPATLTLPRGDGYFGSASYSVEISKQGYSTQYITLTGSMNGWYIAGNIVFGGLIGWLIIDPTSGAMWTLSPETATVNLAATDEKKIIQNNSSELKISLVENVPSDIRSRMIKIRDN